MHSTRSSCRLLCAIATLILAGCGSSTEPGSSAPVIAPVATGTASFLVAPKALALSPKDGKLYVADGGYAGCSPSCIRQVDTTSGAVTAGAVVVGVGTIEGITFDATGDNLYFSDRQNRVTRLTWSGSAYGSPAACDDVAGTPPQDPYHLVDDPTLGILVAEDNGARVAALATCAGTTNATTLSAQSITQPRGIALGPTGQIFVSSAANDWILLVDRTIGMVTKYDSLHVSTPVGVQWLGGSSAYGDALVVANAGDRTVVAVNGAAGKSFGTFPTAPIDVAVAAHNKTIFVLTTVTVATAAKVFRVTGF